MAAARGRLVSAEAGAEAALARFDRAVLTALQEVETALSNYASELQRRQILAAAREQSAAAVGFARTRFDAGADSFLTVLDADRSLAAAEASLAQSDALISTYQIALFKALGGGWQQEQAIVQPAAPAQFVQPPPPPPAE
jgi:outer membrane protein, multidrug efflux system